MLPLEYLCRYRQHLSHPHGQSVILVQDSLTRHWSLKAVFQKAVLVRANGLRLTMATTRKKGAVKNTFFEPNTRCFLNNSRYQSIRIFQPAPGQTGRECFVPNRCWGICVSCACQKMLIALRGWPNTLSAVGTTRQIKSIAVNSSGGLKTFKDPDLVGSYAAILRSGKSARDMAITSEQKEPSPRRDRPAHDWLGPV